MTKNIGLWAIEKAECVTELALLVYMASTPEGTLMPQKGMAKNLKLHFLTVRKWQERLIERGLVRSFIIKPSQILYYELSEKARAELESCHEA